MIPRYLEARSADQMLVDNRAGACQIGTRRFAGSMLSYRMGYHGRGGCLIVDE
jgi:hypothetical protein